MARATKVLAFEPCSACSTSAVSMTLVAASVGTSPLSAYKKLAASDSSGLGITGSRPRRSRSSVATMVGNFATSDRPIRRTLAMSTPSGFGSASASADTAVRRLCMGEASAGSFRSNSSSTGGSATRAARSARNASSCAAVGSSPSHSR